MSICDLAGGRKTLVEKTKGKPVVNLVVNLESSLPPKQKDVNLKAGSHLGPPKNGVIALWPNTRVVKCKYYVSQKQNVFNNKIHWYSIFLTFVFKFTAKL